jgi:hypothetical protein
MIWRFLAAYSISLNEDVMVLHYLFHAVVLQRRDIQRMAFEERNVGLYRRRVPVFILQDGSRKAYLGLSISPRSSIQDSELWRLQRALGFQ